MGRRAIVLLVALVLAGLAAWAVWNFMQNVRGEVEADQEQVTVFRAGTGGIAEGTQGSILLSDFDGGGELIVESTDEFQDTPPDALQSEEALRQVLSNRVAAGPISENAILTSSQWTEVTADVQPLAEQIASGNQAITVSTNDVQGVNGFVEAGDRINMIITLDIEFDNIPVDDAPTLPTPEEEAPAEGEEDTETITVTYTRYVLQGLNVLAVGRDIREEEDGDQTGEIDADQGQAEGEGQGQEGQEGENQGNATVFTLEVTPDQAERVVYAFQNGSIWLTLVPEDFVEIESDGVTIDNLFGGDLVSAIFDDN